VTVASLGKGTKFRTVTDSSGFYDLNDVAPDDYSLRIEADGYKTFENPFVTVYADNTSMVNPKLVNGKSDRSRHRQRGGRERAQNRSDGRGNRAYAKPDHRFAAGRATRAT
jgi:hypothetical protein